MKIYSKLSFILMVMIFSMMITGCKSKLTATASGQVTNVAMDRDTKTIKTKTSSNTTKKKTKTSIETEINYVYTVNGKSYTGYTEKKGDVRSSFQKGSSVVVCYNPANPQESSVFTIGSTCGKS